MRCCRRSRDWIGPALLAFTLALWWPATRGGFVDFDDDVYVTDNAHVLAGLSREGLRWAFELRHTGLAFYWQPLTWLSLMADRTAFGTGPFGFHLVNVALHALNVILVFSALRALTGSAWRSASVAALFAVHPLNVESVAWIVERKTVLSAFLGLLSLVVYASHARRPGLGRYAASLGLFAASLMAKPMLVTFPFLLLMLEVWPLGRLPCVDRPPAEAASTAVPARARVLAEKLPFLLAALASLAMTRLSTAGVAEPSAGRSLLLRVSHAVVAEWRYLGKALCPIDLALFYPYPAAVPPGKAVLAAAALALVTVAVATRWRRSPAALVGWLWFLGTLVPMLGLVQAGMWPAIADRYAYFPLIGLGVALVWGVGDAVEASPRATRIAGITLLAWLGLLAIATRRQIALWRDSVTLLEHAVAAEPEAAEIRPNLATAYLRAGRTDDAIAQFRAALRLDPRQSVAYVGLARAYAARGDLGLAREALNELARVRPGPAVHVELGNLALAEGRLDEAAREYGTAVALDPGLAGPRLNLAEVHRRRGTSDAARRELREALRLDPAYRAAHLALGDLERQAGNAAAAATNYERALQLGGDDAALLVRLGTLYGELGRLDRATGLLEEAVRLAPDRADAHDNLGTAYLLAGSLARAVEQYELATRLAPTSAATHFNLSLAYRRAGRVADAEAAMRRAGQLDPTLVAPAGR